MKRSLSLLSLLLLTACSAAEPPVDNTQPDTAMEPTVKEVPAFNGTLLSGKVTAVIQTTMGDITVELDADAAPKTVTNFATLAEGGYYDNLIFHRVIPDFMIQGGDPNGNGTGGESIFGGTFEDEINAETYGLQDQKLEEVSGGRPLPDALKDASVKEYYEMQGYEYDTSLESLPMDRGYLAMANRGANTNGSQFFIIQKQGGTNWLEGKHTVFGKVTDGMDVVDAIAGVERDGRDMPLEPISYTVEIQ